MAPVDIAGPHIPMGYSSLEMGIISLVAFLVLCIVLVSLCAQCQRNDVNAYDVSGTTQTDGAGGPNGAVGTKTEGNLDSSLNWRSHNNMPERLPSTLERTRASTK